MTGTNPLKKSFCDIVINILAQSQPNADHDDKNRSHSHGMGQVLNPVIYGSVFPYYGMNEFPKKIKAQKCNNGYFPVFEFRDKRHQDIKKRVFQLDVDQDQKPFVNFIQKIHFNQDKGCRDAVFRLSRKTGRKNYVSGG